jgi:hypothetical protein
MTTKRFVDDPERIRVLATVAENLLHGAHPCTQALMKAIISGKPDDVDKADRAIRELPSTVREQLLLEAKKRMADDESVRSFIGARRPSIVH